MCSGTDCIGAVSGESWICFSVGEEKEIEHKERVNVKEITIIVADKIAEVDRQNKKFLEKMGTKVLWALGIGFTAVGAGIGIHSAFGSGESLPQVEDDEDDAV